MRVGELANEFDRVDALPQQVARIEVETELLPVADRFERSLGRVDIERDLGRMHFQREPHAAVAEHIENRIPPLGKLLVTFVDHRIGHRRKRVQQRPDARTGETVHHANAKLLGSPGGVLHVVGGAAIHTGRVAIAPHMRRQNRFVPRIDPIAHCLTNQVRANRMALQVVTIEQVALAPQ